MSASLIPSALMPTQAGKGWSWLHLGLSRAAWQLPRLLLLADSPRSCC